MIGSPQGPVEMTKSTAEPKATKVPPIGLELITRPLNTAAEQLQLTVPTASRAPTIEFWAAAGTREISSVSPPGDLPIEMTKSTAEPKATKVPPIGLELI